MNVEDVVGLYKLFQENSIHVWIDGGWGIDALLGEQTRPHGDLDIAVDRKDVDKLLSLLTPLGYKQSLRSNDCKEKNRSNDWNFILENNGKEVDIHVFEFDENGNNIYGIEYPRKSLTGTGTINGIAVKCISLEYVVKFHENYKPKEKDYKDIEALCSKFGLELPGNYKRDR